MWPTRTHAGALLGMHFRSQHRRTWSAYILTARAKSTRCLSRSAADISVTASRVLVQVLAGMVYMFPKYTLRLLFWRRVGRACASATPLREVRNPDKVHKRHEIALHYGVQPDAHCARIRQFFPLLP
jgi:hypothetical protein